MSKEIHLTQGKATIVDDEAAVRFFGEFAYTNAEREKVTAI